MKSHLPVMPAGKLLDCRTDLLRRASENETFREQIGHLVASQSGMVPANGVFDGANHDLDLMRVMAKKFSGAVDGLVNHLRAAEVYRVSPDMSAMVEFAASQLDDSDLAEPSLAPTQCGIVRFDKPLPVKDVRGQTMLVHWMVWGPGGTNLDQPGVLVWLFNDPKSKPDDTHLALIAQARKVSGSTHVRWYEDMVGRFATVGIDVVQPGKPLGAAMSPPSETQAKEVLAEGTEALPGTNTLRYIHALWLLLNQTVTKVEDEPVNTSARKRAGKARLPAKVTVIRLRREENALGRAPGESMVEWQHRWIVRGHWRWQVVGEHYVGAVETERGYRARIWINPFVKGPEGAPIVQSEKVYSLDR